MDKTQNCERMKQYLASIIIQPSVLNFGPHAVLKTSMVGFCLQSSFPQFSCYSVTFLPERCRECASLQHTKEHCKEHYLPTNII